VQAGPLISCPTLFLKSFHFELLQAVYILKGGATLAAPCTIRYGSARPHGYLVKRYLFGKIFKIVFEKQKQVTRAHAQHPQKWKTVKQYILRFKLQYAL
jgi:hypothetical protein